MTTVFYTLSVSLEILIISVLKSTSNCTKNTHSVVINVPKHYSNNKEEIKTKKEGQHCTKKPSAAVTVQFQSSLENRLLTKRKRILWGGLFLPRKEMN